MLLPKIQIEHAGVNPTSSQVDSKDVKGEKWTRLVLSLPDQEHARVSEGQNQLAGLAEGCKVYGRDYYVHLCV